MTFAQWLNKLSYDDIKALEYFPSIRYYEPTHDVFEQLTDGQIEYMNLLLKHAGEYNHDSNN
jgi:hypothetical protein